MGRSAKLHKRVKKTASSLSNSQSQSQSQTSVAPSANKNTTTTPAAAATAAANASAKKRSLSLRAKASATRPGLKPEGQQRQHVLGGADYVELMMGSRRRARAEAQKLPSSSSAS